jgi:hypothetical protein
MAVTPRPMWEAITGCVETISALRATYALNLFQYPNLPMEHENIH